MNKPIIRRQSLPPEIATRLRELRGALKRWVLVKGTSRWLLLVLAILATDILLDRYFKMDFAQRLIMLAVMVSLAGGLFYWRVIHPLLRRITDDALLHEIEARYPQLKHNLISGAQLARDADLEAKGVSAELARTTIDRSIELARQMEFVETINQNKLAKNSVLLGVGLLLGGALALGVFQSDFLRIWFNRNVLLSDDQWPQATYLEIVGAKDGTLVLPRGTDHRLTVRVIEPSRVSDVDVTVEIDGSAGQSTHQMTPTGKLDGREHLFVMHNVSSELTLRARGGDDVTPDVAIKLVEPPAILDLQMWAVLPDYTKMPNQKLEGPGPHSIPAGGRIRGTAKVNKTLQTISVVSESVSVDLKPTGQPLVYDLNLPDGNDELAGGQYEFQLVDETGLGSIRPGKFAVSIKQDSPPKVFASLLGISGLAVPRARVPVSFNVIDEYGLRDVSFHTNWKNAEQENESGTAGKRDLPIAKFTTSEDAVRQQQDVTVLDLEPFDLSVGTSFRLLVRSTDSRPSEPNSADSAEFLLRIVSEEELRADLLRREIEQRQAFGQAYEAQLELMTELQALAATRPSNQAEQFETDQQSRMIAVARDQKLIGTSLDAIGNRFEEFLVEAQNNRLDEDEQNLAGLQTIADRFENRIIRPIRALDEEWIAMANRNLDNCRRLLHRPDELSTAVGQTTEIHQRILEEMKQIMDAMVDSENFQEVVNRLLEIKRGENQIKEEIRKRQPDENEIFDEEDIFDDD